MRVDKSWRSNTREATLILLWPELKFIFIFYPLRWLQDMGVHLAMLTGDSKETATAVQKQLKLDSCVSEMKPADKLKWIANIKEENTLRKRCCRGVSLQIFPS